MRILAIGRAECFSPNSVEKDRAIMEAVVSRLRAKGHSPLLTSLLGEELIPLMGEEPTPPQAPLFEAREFFPGKSSSPKGEVRWGLWEELLGVNWKSTELNRPVALRLLSDSTYFS